MKTDLGINGFIHRTKCAGKITSARHRCDAQHSWHTRNIGSEDLGSEGSSQNKGTTFKSAFNRSACTPVNLLGKHKLQLQQPEAKLQSLDCSTQHKSLNLMEVGIILVQDAYELQCPLDYKIGTRRELLAVLTELGWVVSGHMTGKRRQNVCHFGFTDDVKVAENIQT